MFDFDTSRISRDASFTPDYVARAQHRAYLEVNFEGKEITITVFDNCVT